MKYNKQYPYSLRQIDEKTIGSQWKKTVSKYGLFLI